MFNLSKHADLDQMVMDGAESIGESIESPENATNSQEDAAGAIIDSGPAADEKAKVLQLQQDQELLGILNGLRTEYPAEIEAINAFLSNQNSFRQLQNEMAALPGLTEQYNMEAITPQVPSFDEYKEKSNNVLNTVRRLNSIRREHERNQIPLGVAAFNLKQHKVAQMPGAMPQAPMQQPMPQAMPQMPMPEEQTGRFPVENEGDFISKFAEDLLAFNNNPGTPEYERARIAAEEIRAAVSPGYEEEANSIIESIMQLDVTQRNTASDYLIKLYGGMIPPALTGDQAGSQMEPVMGEKNQDAIEGIVRFSLTESVLNNNKNAMIKTAADQFGQQYLLYGPTEKRICPKLRGKNLSVGDVVSEYTCRMHCLEGIVIDDNKTICGEALWRANAMDKYSREYVDENGDIAGGYINKRFEVNRNVPEENKMRLKPGETRKPTPAAWGNTESRLQDMRSKEGQTRGYRPETNTGDPFEWCHDSDQNNVEVSQAERDRREEAMGNKLVQYTNRDQGENKPQKLASRSICGRCGDSFEGIGYECPGCKKDESQNKKSFNLKGYKTAQTPVAYAPQDTHQTAVNPAAAGMRPPSDIQSIKGKQGVDSGKPMRQNPIVDPSKAMSLEDMETDKYNFAEGQVKVQSMSNEQLMAAMQDLTKVIDVQEASSRAGASTPKLGYYHDERHTIAGEIQRRRRGTVAGFNLRQHKKAQMETCPKCNASRKKGTPCKCPYTDDGPSNDQTPKVAENPQPHTVALPDHDYWRQNQPQDGHTPDVKPSKKKT